MNLNSILNNLTLITEMIAFIISVILFFKNKKREFLFLMLLMTCIVLAESFAKFNLYKYQNLVKYEILFSNLELYIEAVSYQVILYLLIENTKIKKIILGIIFILLVFPFIKYNQPFTTEYINITYSVGAISAMVFIIYYFVEKIEHIVQEGFSDNFWNIILAFLFIFLAVDTSFMTLINYLKENRVAVDKVEIALNLKYVASILYYTSFIPAAIWLKKI